MKSILAIVAKTAVITATVVITAFAVISAVEYLAHKSGASTSQPNPIAGVFQQIEKPEMPISISFRRAFFGGGGVAIFQNNSGQTLEVEALLSSPTERRARIDLVIPGLGRKEVGPMQGWGFVSGQHIKLVNDNFRPMDTNVP